IRLPMVARRSPAITTPSARLTAMMVVACGAMSAGPGGNGRPPGNSSGAVRLRKSGNEAMPGVVNAAGSRPVESKPADTSFPSDALCYFETVSAPYPAERHDTINEWSCRPRPDAGSLAALLDVAPDELLGILLQHGVDLVEQVVDIFSDLLVS